MLSHLIYNTHLSLLINYLIIILSLIINIILNLITNYFNNLINNIIIHIINIILTLPNLLLTLILITIFNPSINNTTLTLTFITLPHYIHLTHTTILIKINHNYITTSHITNTKTIHQIFINIFPNYLTPLIIQTSLNFSNTILNITTLNFLNIKTQPPTPK